MERPSGMGDAAWLEVCERAAEIMVKSDGQIPARAAMSDAIRLQRGKNAA